MQRSHKTPLKQGGGFTAMAKLARGVDSAVTLIGMQAPSNNKRTLLFAFLMVATLFFIWGFCHAMLDVLNKHFQNILHVSKTQSGFIQTSVFGAYFLLAFPSALLIRRIGYQKGILLGLLVVAVGAFLFVPAGLWFKTFGAFLFALFVLSSGLACIETAANPYVTVLGPKDGAAGRLSVAQAFNSVAYIIAPSVGGALMPSLCAVAPVVSSDAPAILTNDVG